MTPKQQQVLNDSIIIYGRSRARLELSKIHERAIDLKLYKIDDPTDHWLLFGLELFEFQIYVLNTSDIDPEVIEGRNKFYDFMLKQYESGTNFLVAKLAFDG